MKEKVSMFDNFMEWMAVFAWIAGIVVAEGGWSIFFAIVFPPWAWYLLVEHMFLLWGVI